MSQPEGPSFTLAGIEISWDRSRFRFGFNIREGLVLCRMGFEDKGRQRSILDRATVSEMLVTYEAVRAAVRGQFTLVGTGSSLENTLHG